MVHIVGAGPGAADLLTLRALDRLQRADVVLHDRLIDPQVLAHIPATARRVYVGKASGRHVVSQARIHELLIQHARGGERVVRLKGGDPFVFGRGGEEMLALRAAGVPFEVVPGVSAANGCAAAVGIPLTHRGLATTCVFLPGHLADEHSKLDWPALALPGQTRVFYMGVERIAGIAQALLAHGLPADTPAAIVRDGTRDGQTVLATSLSQLLRQAPAYGPQPGLLVIGETVALSPYYQAPGAPQPPEPEAIAEVTEPTRTSAFTGQERAGLYRAIAARRDMRHFVPGSQVDAATLRRLLEAAHRAPSVGLMQPWRFARIADPALRAAIALLVDAERARTAMALGDRSEEFLRLKVEGIRDCAELLVAVLAPDDGTVFGRRTMPRDMALCSVACAIQNLWLAARAENLGLGWVSMFEPRDLAALLQLPPDAQPVALLCLGPVPTFYDAPMLEQEDWRHGRPLDELLFTDRWKT